MYYGYDDSLENFWHEPSSPDSFSGAKYYARPMGNDPTTATDNRWEVVHLDDGVVRSDVSEDDARDVADTWNKLEAMA